VTRVAFQPRNLLGRFGLINNYEIDEGFLHIAMPLWAYRSGRRIYYRVIHIETGQTVSRGSFTGKNSMKLKEEYMMQLDEPHRSVFLNIPNLEEGKTYYVDFYVRRGIRGLFRKLTIFRTLPFDGDVENTDSEYDSSSSDDDNEYFSLARRDRLSTRIQQELID
jgi:hypothetical protein